MPRDSEDSALHNHLTFIKANFKVLKESITKLEERLPLRVALGITEDVKKSLMIPKYAGKLEDILNKNPRFQKMVQIDAVLTGQEVEGMKEDPNIIAKFSCALMVSVDCERAFSLFKDLFSSKRTSLTEAHLRDHMIVQWNKALP